jgi:hypothetical protein
VTTQIFTRSTEMHLLHEDLARAHCRASLKDAEQNRRFRLAHQIEKAQKQAERASRRAERASARARLALARLV